MLISDAVTQNQIDSLRIARRSHTQKIRSLRSKGFDEYMQCRTKETYLEIRGLNKQIANINTQINLLKELDDSANMLNTQSIEKDAVNRDFVMSVYGGK